MSEEESATTPKRGTIRFEDLGEPVQRLLKNLKGDVSDEDMALLEYVSVKDMAKIYGEIATDRHAEEIWEELRAALQARKDKAARREEEFLEKQRALEEERLAEEARQQQQLEEEERERAAEETNRQRRQEELRRQQLEDEANAAALAEQAAEEERAAALAEAERSRKAEKKRKRREARARELQEEQEALDAERARHAAKRQAAQSQKKDWSDYVQSHPLEFCDNTAAEEAKKEIEQQKMLHILNCPPKPSAALMHRTYTARCPQCTTKYAQPPPKWECPLCQRRDKKQVLVWQPDADSTSCMVCSASIGRWSRHHCRSCGRLTCSRCCETRAVIPAMGYTTPAKVCDDCASKFSQ